MTSADRGGSLSRVAHACSSRRTKPTSQRLRTAKRTAAATSKMRFTTTWFMADGGAVNPQRVRHQGGGALRARRFRPAARPCCGCGWWPERRDSSRSRLARLRRRLRPPDPEADEFLRRAHSGRFRRQADEERRVARQAYAGLLWSKQFYHYVVKDWLEGDPDQPPPPAFSPVRPQSRLAPPVQSRHHLDARQVGVSVVRRVGPGVPHDPDGEGRPRVRQGAAGAVPARMVPAPQRPDAGLRMGVLRREPAGARLGLLARLQDDRPARRARSSLPRQRVHEAAAELHLVGQSQGRGGQSSCSPAASWGSTTSASSIARSRCPAAAASNRPTAPPGWRSTAPRCSRWRWSWPSDDATYEDIASKFFEHFVHIADAMNTLGGMGLWHEADGFYYDQLRVDGTAVPLGIRSIVGIIPLFAVEVLEEDDIDRLPGLPQADGVVPQASARPGPAHRLLRTCRRRTVTITPVTACLASHRASGWSACCATCSTRANSCRRTAYGRCRAFIATARSCCGATVRNTACDYVPGESDTRPVRRQLELARPDLVPGELPAHRGAGTIPPLLRRRGAGRMSATVRGNDES